MPLAASRSPREVTRSAQTTGVVLDRSAMSALPRIGEAEVLPAGPQLDEPSWRARGLWLAVLAVALSDARGKGFGAGVYREIGKGVARAWLRRPSADRDLVLELAGMDVAAFESRGLPLLEAKWQRLDAQRAEQRCAA